MSVSWDDLSSYQKSIIKHISGPTLVLAGPGTGKTEILAHKIAYLRSVVNAPKNDVIAITFSRKATNEMIDRVASFQGMNKDSARITTLHSLALYFLHKMKMGRPYVLSKDETIFIMKDAVEDIEKKTVQLTEAMNYLSLINSLKTKGANYQNISNAKLRKIYQRYEQLLEFNRVQDLEGIILRAVNKLASVNSNPISSKYLLVDEFQDLNKTEFRFIKNLAAGSEHLFAVGDDDQSIYGWRGADPSIIVDFTKVFNGATIFNLETSFRVPENILMGAISVVEKIGIRVKKVLKSIKKDGEKIKIVVSDTAALECDWIVTKISELIADGFAPNQIAVLAKELSLLDNVSAHLKNKNIAYLYWGEKNLFSEVGIQVLMSVLRVLTDRGDNLAIRTCIETINSFNIGPVKIKALRDSAEIENLTFWNILVNAEKFKATMRWNRDYKKFVSFILDIEERIYDKSVRDIIKHVGNVLGIDKETSFLDLLEMAEKSGCSGLKEFTEYYHQEKSNNSERERLVQESVDRVNLMSIHSSQS